MNSSAKGNLAMTVAKVFSGLNENALKYLLPRYMDAFSGVVLRLTAGSLLFWLYGLYTRREAPAISWRDRGILFLVGIVVVFGYMITLLEGLSYTTPISSSIFISLQPVWVYIICLFLRTERLSWGRVAGIILGFGGALLIILTQHGDDVASDPLKGNMFCLASSVLFASYLVIEKKFLKRLSNAQVSKWTFFGGAVAAVCAIFFMGWDAPVLKLSIFSVPMLVLLFVLIFPTFVSYLLQDIALKVLPATVVALYGDLILIVAAIASYILGQDHFSWFQILAIVLMIGSVYLVEVSERKAQPAPSAPSAK